MATQAEIESLMREAGTKLKAGDHDGAIDDALAAEALLASIPDHRHGELQLTWGREQIAAWIQSVRAQKRARAAAGGIQRMRVKYQGVRE
jgi:hypothetical protein